MGKIKKIKIPSQSAALDLVDAGAVRFDESQTLNATQKNQARDNIGAGTGTYSKPDNGIPKTDLASGVQASLDKADSALMSSLLGAVNGVAQLDSTGKVPSSQLPSYVDDVIEANSKSAFPAVGETGKIYVAKDTNLTYRWSGSAYVEISPSLALGETSSTAYPGDKGAAAYAHATAKGSAFSSGLYKITTNSEGHVTAASAVAKADLTGLGASDVAETGYSLDFANGTLTLKNKAGTALDTATIPAGGAVITFRNWS